MREKLIVILTYVLPCNAVEIRNFSKPSEIVANRLLLAHVAVFPDTAISLVAICPSRRHCVVVTAHEAAVTAHCLHGTRTNLELDSIVVGPCVAELPLKDCFSSVGGAVVPKVVVRNELERTIHHLLKSRLSLRKVAETCSFGSRHIGITQKHRSSVGSSTSRVVGLRAVFHCILKVVDDELPDILLGLTSITKLSDALEVEDRHASEDESKLHCKSGTDKACFAIHLGSHCIFFNKRLQCTDNLGSLANLSPAVSPLVGDIVKIRSEKSIVAVERAATHSVFFESLEGTRLNLVGTDHALPDKAVLKHFAPPFVAALKNRFSIFRRGVHLVLGDCRLGIFVEEIAARCECKRRQGKNSQCKYLIFQFHRYLCF